MWLFPLNKRRRDGGKRGNHPFFRKSIVIIALLYELNTLVGSTVAILHLINLSRFFSSQRRCVRKLVILSLYINDVSLNGGVGENDDTAKSVFLSLAVRFFRVAVFVMVPSNVYARISGDRAV